MSDLAAQYPEARPLIKDGTAHREQGTQGLALRLETTEAPRVGAWLCY